MAKSLWNFNVVHLERNEAAVKSTTLLGYLNKAVKRFLFQGWTMNLFYSLCEYSPLPLKKAMIQILTFAIEIAWLKQGLIQPITIHNHC